MASEVSRAVLEKALRLAEAAHDEAAIADLKGRLGGQGTPKAPTRQVLSKAFYMAAADRNKEAMRDIMGRIQKAGMTLVPMNEAQVSEADKRGAEDTLKDYNWLERAGLGFQQSVAQTGRGIHELYDAAADAIHPRTRSLSELITGQPAQTRLQQYRRANEGQIGDVALSHDTAGEVGNLAGQAVQIAATEGAAGVGLKAAGLTGRALEVGKGALGFGTYAGLQPTDSLAGHAENAAFGGIFGGLTPYAPVVLSKLAGLARKAGMPLVDFLRLFSEHGRATLAAKRIAQKLQESGINMDTLRAELEQAKGTLPGEVPTLRQGSPGVETLQVERTLRNNPRAQIPLVKRDIANDALRVGAVRAMAKTDDELKAAYQARASRFAQFQAKYLNPESPDAYASPKPVIDAIQKLSVEYSGNTPVQRVLASARKDLMDHLQDNGTVPTQVLQGIRMHARENLVSEMNGGDPSRSAIKGIGELANAAKDSLVKGIPGYEAAMKQYADDSKPIHAMEGARTILADLEKRTLNPDEDPHLTLSDINRALRREEHAEFKMAPADRAKLEDIRTSLKKSAVANYKIGTQGSDTDANQQLRRIMENPWSTRVIGGFIGGGVGSQAGAMHGSHFSEAGALTGMGLGMLGSHVMDAPMKDVLTKEGELAASSPKAAEALKKLSGFR